MKKRTHYLLRVLAVVVAFTAGWLAEGGYLRAGHPSVQVLPGSLQAGVGVFSPDGRFVVGGAQRAWVNIWDTARNVGVGQLRLGRVGAEYTGRLLMHEAPHLYSAGFSGDGSYLALGMMDGSVHLFDWKRREQIRVFVDPRKSLIGQVAFSASSDHLWVRGATLQARTDVWELSTGEQLASIDGARALGASLSEQVVAVGLEKQIDIYSSDGRKVIGSVVDFEGTVQDLTYSPDGRHMAVCLWNPSRNEQVRVWNDKGQFERAMEIPGAFLKKLAWSSDSRYLAAGGEYGVYGKVYVWDMRDGSLAAEVLLPDVWNMSVLAFEPGTYRILHAEGLDLRLVDVFGGES